MGRIALIDRARQFDFEPDIPAVVALDDEIYLAATIAQSQVGYPCPGRLSEHTNTHGGEGLKEGPEKRAIGGETFGALAAEQILTPESEQPRC